MSILLWIQNLVTTAPPKVLKAIISETLETISSESNAPVIISTESSQYE